MWMSVSVHYVGWGDRPGANGDTKKRRDRRQQEFKSNTDRVHI